MHLYKFQVKVYNDDNVTDRDYIYRDPVNSYEEDIVNIVQQVMISNDIQSGVHLNQMLKPIMNRTYGIFGTVTLQIATFSHFVDFSMKSYVIGIYKNGHPSTTILADCIGDNTLVQTAARKVAKSISNKPEVLKNDFKSELPATLYKEIEKYL